MIGYDDLARKIRVPEGFFRLTLLAELGVVTVIAEATCVVRWLGSDPRSPREQSFQCFGHHLKLAITEAMEAVIADETSGAILMKEPVALLSGNSIALPRGAPGAPDEARIALHQLECALARARFVKPASETPDP